MPFSDSMTTNCTDEGFTWKLTDTKDPGPGLSQDPDPVPDPSPRPDLGATTPTLDTITTRATITVDRILRTAQETMTIKIRLLGRLKFSIVIRSTLDKFLFISC